MRRLVGCCAKIKIEIVVNDFGKGGETRSDVKTKVNTILLYNTCTD
jgi:hypothetical protein